MRDASSYWIDTAKNILFCVGVELVSIPQTVSLEPDPEKIVLVYSQTVS
jgi:hypothetical protein